jgi:L-ascorbate metabolism protein UlaG (beta-lactamase superfamily)
MGSVHVSPAQAVQGQQDLGAKVAVGMHWGTFPLADEGCDEPVVALNKALDRTEKDSGVRPVFWVLGFGEGRDVP